MKNNYINKKLLLLVSITIFVVALLFFGKGVILASCNACNFPDGCRCNCNPDCHDCGCQDGTGQDVGMRCCNGGGGGPPPCTPAAAGPTPTRMWICYDNDLPAMPQDPSFIHGGCIEITGTTAANPIKLKVPIAGEALRIVVLPVTAPANTSRLTYYFRDDVNGNMIQDSANEYWSTNIPENYSADISSTILEGGSYTFWAHSATESCGGGPNWGGALIAYAKFDNLPHIVSMTPVATGLSGAIGSNGNPALCSNNNPTDFTVTYSDADGASDISVAGLWIADRTPVNSNLYLNGSAHPLVMKGTEVKIFVYGYQSGPAGHVCMQSWNKPSLELLVDGVVVKSFPGFTGYQMFTYYHPTPLTASQVTVRFPNDCYDNGVSPVANNDILVDKIKLQGITYEAENPSNSFNATGHVPELTLAERTSTLTSDGYPYQAVNIGWPNGYVTFSGSTVQGSTNYVMYGMQYDQNTHINCNGSELNCSLNYQWPTAGTDIYAAAPGTYSDTTTPVTGSPAHWTLLNAAATGANTVTLSVRVYFTSNLGGTLYRSGFTRDYFMGQNGWSNTPTGLSTPLWQWRLDFAPPSIGNPAPTVLDQNTFRYNWTIDDGLTGSGVIESTGYPRLNNSGYTTSKTVTDGAKGVVLSPAPGNGLDTYSTDYLWSKTWPGSTVLTRTGPDDVGIGVINKGDLVMRVCSTDLACNRTCVDSTNGSIGSSWLVTKGGLVYSGGTVNDPVKDVSSALPTYTWVAPYSLTKLETQISTELLQTSGGTISTGVISGKVNTPFQSQSAIDLSSSGFSQILTSFNNKPKTGITMLTTLTTSSTSTSGCTSGSKCIFSLNSTTLPANFICDSDAMFMVTGDLTITSNLSIDDLSNINHGCIFLVSGNVIINDGDTKSVTAGSTTPLYDTIDAFIITGGYIKIMNGDINLSIQDGITVNGGLIAYGGNPSTPSIDWERTLKLKDNLLYPSITVHNDPRYLLLSRNFFVSDSYTYIREVGYKPY